MPYRRLLASFISTPEKVWPSIATVILVPTCGVIATALAYAFELGKAAYYHVPAQLIRVEFGTVFGFALLVTLLSIGPYGMRLTTHMLPFRVRFFELPMVLLLMGAVIVSIAMGIRQLSDAYVVMVLVLATLVVSVVLRERHARRVGAAMRKHKRSKPFRIVGISLIFVLFSTVLWFRPYGVAIGLLAMGAVILTASVGWRWGPTRRLMRIVSVSLRSDRPSWGLLIAIAIASIPLAWCLGMGVARSKSNFYVVESDPQFALVAIYGELFIFREWEDHIHEVRLGARMKVRHNDEIAKVTLIRLEIGQLQPPLR
jgi:hypothetical protein